MRADGPDESGGPATLGAVVGGSGAETGPPEVLARADGVLGEVVLRRRATGAGRAVYELIVNGVFLMDTAETSTEELLAELVLDHRPAPERILVGGLGLGRTLLRLVADPRPHRIDVVEIEPQLVDWLRGGRVPEVAAALADPRVRVLVADVAAVLGTPPTTYDAIVLDVDNGPDFLVADRNAALYRAPALGRAARAVRPGGRLLVWSADPAPRLRAELARQVGPVRQVVRTVARQGREFDYHLYLATRATGTGDSPSPRQRG